MRSSDRVKHANATVNVGGPLQLMMPSLLLELIGRGERDSGVLRCKLHPGAHWVKYYPSSSEEQRQSGWAFFWLMC
jgi:hypothetical protein